MDEYKNNMRENKSQNMSSMIPYVENMQNNPSIWHVQTHTCIIKYERVHGHNTLQIQDSVYNREWRAVGSLKIHGGSILSRIFYS